MLSPERLRLHSVEYNVNLGGAIDEVLRRSRGARTCITATFYNNNGYRR